MLLAPTRLWSKGAPGPGRRDTNRQSRVGQEGADGTGRGGAGKET